MDRIKNPFAPGAGSAPPELVGREGVIEEAQITCARIKAGKPAKSFFLVGLRGVGKTVLLNRLQDIAEKDGYKAISIEAPETKRLPELLIPKLRTVLLQLDRMEQLSEHVKKALGMLKGFANAAKLKVGEIEFGLNIDPEVGADTGVLDNDLPELFLAVAQAAASRNLPVGIFIDEMQYLTEDELSGLIMAVHKVTQKQLPLLLVGAGLPQLVGLAGRSKSYAERLFDYPAIGPLKESDAKNAVSLPVIRQNERFEPAALDEIYRVTKGYPYFLQEWGYVAWNLADRSPITLGTVKSAHDAVTQRLDESFFRVRFDRLTPREKQYLRAMAELGPGPHRSGEVADTLEVEVRSIAPVRGSLIKKGMVYSPAHGDTAFTVPLFDEFMKRTMPPPRRSKHPGKHVTPE